jgi:hypothetical protein
MTAVHLEDLLKQWGHTPKVCFTCSAVRDALKADGFDYYILDLNAAFIGLDTDQKGMTQGGLLTGWILLWKFILPADPHAWEKTIFFSDFVPSLKKHVCSLRASEEEKELYSQLDKRQALIPKRDGYAALGNRLKSFSRQV